MFLPGFRNWYCFCYKSSLHASFLISLHQDISIQIVANQVHTSLCTYVQREYFVFSQTFSFQWVSFKYHSGFLFGLHKMHWRLGEIESACRRTDMSIIKAHRQYFDMNSMDKTPVCSVTCPFTAPPPTHNTTSLLLNVRFTKPFFIAINIWNSSLLYLVLLLQFG